MIDATVDSGRLVGFLVGSSTLGVRNMVMFNKALMGKWL
jgi:hypothetical protein